MKLIYAVIIALILAAGASSLSSETDTALQNGILRLHIVADNDSPKAQSVKIAVRDEIIKNVSLNDKDFLNEAVKCANNVLIRKNENYEARGEIGKFYFPKKQYKNIVLPQGYYYGIRIILGNGAGQNWWCIMYPPMCSLNATEMAVTDQSAKKLKRILPKDAYELITSNDGKVKIKFKTIEIIRSVQNYLKQ